MLSMTDRAVWRLEPEARSPELARRLVRNALAPCPPQLVESASLVISELVTNAVLHARTEMTLTVEEQGRGVRIAVTDRSPVAPALRHHSATATTGRGLRLLNQLADTWSVTADNGGKTVWFSLTSDRDPWAGYDVDSYAEAEA